VVINENWHGSNWLGRRDVAFEQKEASDGNIMRTLSGSIFVPDTELLNPFFTGKVELFGFWEKSYLGRTGQFCTIEAAERTSG
jgi:predicted nuclease of restriction endonuclease-like RecB superfamily